MKVFLLSFLLSILCLSVSSQAKGVVDDLEKLMKENKYEEAKLKLDARLPLLISSRYPDTLISYPKYIGKINAKLADDETAIRLVGAFAEKVKTAGAPPNVVFRVYLESAIFYSLKGKHSLAYETVLGVQKQVASLLSSSPVDAALAQSELGVYGYRMGNIGLSGQHHRKATSILESLAEPNYERLYNSYNSMGTIMWFSSRIDSGIYYFDKAIGALKKLPPTPENKNYRVGIVQNNLSQLYNEKGRTSEAIHTLEEGILNMKTFLASPEPNPKKDFANIRQYEFIDNLARIYRQLGDFSKGEYLLTYSFREKQKSLPANGPDIYKSLISLGGLYYEQMNYKKAEQYLLDGLKMVRMEPNPSPLWAGEACNSLSRVYDAMGNVPLAEQYFHLTDSLYEVSYQGEYDETYLDFLRESSLFYARQHQGALAISKADKGLQYIIHTQGKETLSAFQQVLNVADVQYQLGNFQQSLALGREAVSMVNNRISASTQLLDSVRAELRKPGAILLMSRSEYKLLKTDDIAGMKRLLVQLAEALDVIRRKRAIIKEPADINLMMSQNKDLLDFTKELQVRLFELTGDESLIDQVIDLHETAIYNRIRARLDKQRAVRFAEVPAEVQQQEERLLAAVSESLRSGRTESDGIHQYIAAEKSWKDFQEMLRKKYPKYYAMRYADLEKRKVSQLSRFVPDGVTVIRYFNIGGKYFALLADKNKHHWVPLQATQADEWIRQLADPSQDEKSINRLCYDLYKILWQPLEKNISNKRVMVIPDGPLYYLSFEMLVKKPVAGFRDYVAASLLSSYAISYHYSFFALEPTQSQPGRRAGFAAFVPGFSDDVKENYLSS
ncbi:MAG: CHAT domain-containing protein, partial [Chitinophagaceae bacterium]